MVTTFQYLTPEGDETPAQTAWARIASFLELFTSEADDSQRDLVEAADYLDKFVNETPYSLTSEDLEWGDPGDCWERLYGDPDYREDPVFAPLLAASDNVSGGPEDEAVQEYAKANDLGRHYGYPHCIWCLEAS